MLRKYMTHACVLNVHAIVTVGLQWLYLCFWMYAQDWTPYATDSFSVLISWYSQGWACCLAQKKSCHTTMSHSVTLCWLKLNILSCQVSMSSWNLFGNPHTFLLVFVFHKRLNIHNHWWQQRTPLAPSAGNDTSPITDNNTLSIVGSNTSAIVGNKTSAILGNKTAHCWR